MNGEVDRWNSVLERLEKADHHMDEQLEGEPEVEKESDPLVYSWVLNLHEAYERVRDEVIEVTQQGKDPEEAVKSAGMAIQDNVLRPFSRIEDQFSDYNNYAEIFSVAGYDRMAETVPDEVNVFNPEEIGQNFHPNLAELREQYEVLVNIYQDEVEERNSQDVIRAYEA